MNSVWSLLAIGFVFHLVYLISIFDIYFISPLVLNLSPIHYDHLIPQPPADRLVLIVGDGLRADRLFEDPNRAPFLSEIIQKHGAYGVSHTRVPTESRPGHVAIIAGFYEDVSAVTKGWKFNPVEFDSVFNQSHRTWSFGSPDILPMFKHGAADPSKIETFMYSAEEEDFAKKDASQLDGWVFKEFDSLFSRAALNETLNKQLWQQNIVFFLHLLGLDTNGHAHRPHSQEYLENIRFVDDGIRRMVDSIERFYGADGRTAFIFTADHGMSNIGNHGDGNPDNTRTPLIAWGSGLRGPVVKHPVAEGHDAFSIEWLHLRHLSRTDVNQADIAPLMAALIGVPFPVNSVGELPVNYLQLPEKQIAEFARINSDQILAQFIRKQELKQNTELWYKPFPLLGGDAINQRLDRIRQLIQSTDYRKAIAESGSLIRDALAGLRYYQTYDWFFLRSVITLGYLGWMLYCFIFLLTNFVIVAAAVASPSSSPRSSGAAKWKWTWSQRMGSTVCALLFSGLAYQHSPLTYYFYVGLMVYFWTAVGDRFQVITQWLQMCSRRVHWYVPFGEFTVYLLALEALVLSYFYRPVLFCWLTGMGLLWPLTVGSKVRSSLGWVLLAWLVSCSLTGSFMLLPVELHDELWLMWSGAAVVIAMGGVAALYFHSNKNGGGRLVRLIIVQVSLCISAILLVNSTVQSLAARTGLPPINQYLTWLTLITSLIYPLSQLAYCRQPASRLVVLYLTFAPMMIILSVSYEVLFYSSYFSTLLLWLHLEQTIYYQNDASCDNYIAAASNAGDKRDYRPLNRRDARIGLLFLLFINVAFFGTGNIASIASFQLTSVYRLTTVFNPFLMTALLMLKMITPFLFLAATFTLLTSTLALHPLAIYVVTLCVSDIMTLNFFYLVRDEGSWLEIGMGISHFVIVCMWEVISGLLIGSGWLLIRGVQLASDAIQKRKRK